MRLRHLFLLPAAWATLTALGEPARVSEATLATAKVLQEKARSGSGAFAIVESLTTEVGPRLAGSANDPLAVAWGERTMKALGFDRVWTEPVEVEGWQRIAEHAEILSPTTQPLSLAALGGSPSTPAGGVEAEVVGFADMAALEAAPLGSLTGKIAYIASRMERGRDASGYGVAVKARGDGPILAARRGASALLIRSIGTDHRRSPHTGLVGWLPDVARIPAGALSVVDAEQMDRLLARGAPVRIKLVIETAVTGPKRSANVIGEIKGTDPAGEIVLLGAHLDSWDLGTGALDDGAGIGIVLGVAKLIRALPEKPRRTLRVVLFAAEETGIHGARAYAAAHGEEVGRHVLAVEADLGAGPVWRMKVNFDADGAAVAAALETALKPLQLESKRVAAHGGPDVGPMVRKGVPAVDLDLDSSDYFDIHHTAEDTLDKVDPKALDQSVSAYVTAAWIGLQAEGRWKSAAAAVITGPTPVSKTGAVAADAKK